MYDENELVRLAAEDDIGAFEKLVALYEKRVYTMALRMTGNPDDAFDISQEAFIRVHRSIKGFKGDSKFSTWIYRIVSNLCIDFNRKQKRIKQVPLERDDEDEPFKITITDSRFEPERNLERCDIARYNMVEAASRITYIISFS
jgi:RNA polymerase sigma factor (sigma-70 family)